MHYGDKLRELRQKLNLSQNEVAEILNIARITYNHYETQEKIIPIERLNQVCNFYNVSIDYVLGFNKIKNYEKYNNIDNKKVALRIKEFRKENNLTQAKLANILNTNQCVIANYERGRNIIATPFLYTICSKYNISADYLLGKIDDPKYLN